MKSLLLALTIINVYLRPPAQPGGFYFYGLGFCNNILIINH
jgi:hypothetical protein